VTAVDDSYRPVHDYKQNSIGSAIAGAEQHLTDWYVEVDGFRRWRTALRRAGEGLDTLPCANAPLGRRSRSTVPNITIYVAKIGFGFRRDNDAIT
jgi:hypothetical protein